MTRHPRPCETCGKPIGHDGVTTWATMDTPEGTIASPANQCATCMIKTYRADLIRSAAIAFADQVRDAIAARAAMLDTVDRRTAN